MTPIPIPSLPSQDTPEAVDLLLLMVGGVANKATLGSILSALAVATTGSKGLMSATDKVVLDTNTTNLNNLVNAVSQALPASATLIVPSGKYFITLSGTTEVTNLVLPTKNITYYIWYPTGAGVTVMGQPIEAGDPPLEFIDTP